MECNCGAIYKWCAAGTRRNSEVVGKRWERFIKPWRFWSEIRVARARNRKVQKPEPRTGLRPIDRLLEERDILSSHETNMSFIFIAQSYRRCALRVSRNYPREFIHRRTRNKVYTRGGNHDPNDSYREFLSVEHETLTFIRRNRSPAL